MLRTEDFAEELVNEGFTPFDIETLDKESILDRQVFEHIFAVSDQLARTGLIIKLQDKARTMGMIRSFDKLLKAYQTEFAQRYKQKGSNVIEFTNPPIKDLKCGKWECRDTGITKSSLGAGMMPVTSVACSHPMLPVERLVNVDTETEKIKLAFFKDDRWQNIVVDRSTVANKSNIIQLSDRGVEVNSENSKELVSYIADMVSLNMKEIPVYRSINRLGWLDGKFAPFIDDLKYDGDIAYKDLYESFKPCGDYEEWKQLCIEIRKKSKVAHLLLASSFASSLIDLLGILPFIVHVWGGTGAGKTVGLMLAMSIWGNPEIGKLVRTLNATQVALARQASFLHDVPFAGDELQSIKSRWENFDQLIMYLTEGLDRGRGKAYGGLEEAKEWNCCFLFTGEEPITKTYSGGGTKNRVIEIEAVEKIIEDGNFVSNFLRGNYGFAGKEFVNNLPHIKDLQKRFNQITKEILERIDTTDKQALSMGAILLADELATGIIFQDGSSLTINDVRNYLTSQADIDVATRAYTWTLDWIDTNRNKFSTESPEIWGKFNEIDGYCLVNKTVYEHQLDKAGFSYSAIIGKLAERGQIERNSQGKCVHQTRAYGIKASYIKFLFETETIEEFVGDIPKQQQICLT